MSLLLISVEQGATEKDDIYDYGPKPLKHELLKTAQCSRLYSGNDEEEGGGGRMMMMRRVVLMGPGMSSIGKIVRIAICEGLHVVFSLRLLWVQLLFTTGCSFVLLLQLLISRSGRGA